MSKDKLPWRPREKILRGIWLKREGVLIYSLELEKNNNAACNKSKLYVLIFLVHLYILSVFFFSLSETMHLAAFLSYTTCDVKNITFLDPDFDF